MFYQNRPRNGRFPLLKTKIIFRQERSYCQVCWTQAATTDFELTTGKTGATGKAPDTVNMEDSFTNTVFINRGALKKL